MGREIFRCSVLALALLGIAGTAAAHHPPRFERCQSITFTGQIERIEWANPHVRLFIRSDDGMSHEMAWLNLQRLRLIGIQRDTLRTGDQVVVTGGIRTQDAAALPILLSTIRRPSDGWEWSQPVQGC
jgi:hypothetical protein